MAERSPRPPKTVKPEKVPQVSLSLSLKTPERSPRPPKTAQPEKEPEFPQHLNLDTLFPAPVKPEVRYLCRKKLTQNDVKMGMNFIGDGTTAFCASRSAAVGRMLEGGMVCRVVVDNEKVLKCTLKKPYNENLKMMKGRGELSLNHVLEQANLQTNSTVDCWVLLGSDTDFVIILNKLQEEEEAA